MTFFIIVLLFLCCKWFFESSVAGKNFLSLAQGLYPPPTRISLAIHNYSIEFLFLQHLMSLFDNLSESASGYLLFVGRTRRITQDTAVGGMRTPCAKTIEKIKLIIGASGFGFVRSTIKKADTPCGVSVFLW